MYQWPWLPWETEAALTGQHPQPLETQNGGRIMACCFAKVTSYSGRLRKQNKCLKTIRNLKIDICGTE